jgi:hypothetical protein
LTHHGPDSGEATTFPHIIFSVLLCARKKKKAKGARVRDLQQKIRLAKVQLQRDPEDEPAREILSVAQGHLVDSL